MSANVLVTVVIATRNRPIELERALQSVLTQTYTNYQIVVVDDNDPDSSSRAETARVVADCGAEVSYVQNSAPRGGAGARNVGIDHARGDLVAFLDDDDEWLPQKLEKQLLRFTELGERVACVDTGFYRVYSSGKPTRTILPVLQGNIFDNLLTKQEGRAPKLSSLVCKKSALVEVQGFDEQLPARQDLDLYIRLARRFEFDSVREPLVKNHIHQNERISSGKRNKLLGYDIIYQKHYNAIARNRSIHSAYLTKHATMLLEHGSVSDARRKLVKALRCNPGNLRAIVLLLQSILSLHQANRRRS